jgi:hypothetical protein
MGTEHILLSQEQDKMKVLSEYSVRRGSSWFSLILYSFLIIYIFC